MKITYSVAMSRDGFIAREDGDVSWLDDFNDSSALGDWEAFFDSIDGLVMGRSTYDFVFNHGTWPYGGKPAWVCTSRPVESMEGANLRIVKTIDDTLAGTSAAGCTHLWLVGGGQLASAFLERDLITHISIAEMPVELGKGIPLFAGHKLEELAVASQSEVEKNGYRQIEIVLA